MFITDFKSMFLVLFLEQNRAFCSAVAQNCILVDWFTARRKFEKAVEHILN